jgi:hypothetical protein
MGIVNSTNWPMKALKIVVVLLEDTRGEMIVG